MNPLSRCDVVGRGVRVLGHPLIENHGWMEIGDGAMLCAEPSPCQLVTGPHGTLLLGARVVIGHGVSIAAHLSVSIGDGAHVDPYALVMDTNFHDLHDPLRIPAPRAITIGAEAVIGANCVLLPGAQVGAGARLRAGSVVSGPIAGGAIVSGVPALEGRSAAFGAMVEDAVLQSMQEAFRLPRPPPLSATRAQIAGWDDAGALRLVLALERRPGLSIRGAEVARARSVAEVLRAVAPRFTA